MIYVIADIHGNAQGLESALRALGLWTGDPDAFKFDPAWPHKLIFLGDIVDRGPHSSTCVTIIQRIKQIFGDRCIVLRGNHEQLMLDALDDDELFNIWVNYQNGDTTIDSYSSKSRQEFVEVAKDHLSFIGSLPYWHEEVVAEKTLLFCHAGIHPKGSKETGFNSPDEHNSVGRGLKRDLSVVWIRDDFFANTNMVHKLNKLGYEKVFIGHTPTFSHRHQFNKKLDPGLVLSPRLTLDDRVVSCDTGSGYCQGKLTVVQIDGDLKVSVAWQEN